MPTSEIQEICCLVCNAWNLIGGIKIEKCKTEVFCYKINEFLNFLSFKSALIISQGWPKQPITEQSKRQTKQNIWRQKICIHGSYWFFRLNLKTCHYAHHPNPSPNPLLHHFPIPRTDRIPTSLWMSTYRLTDSTIRNSAPVTTYTHPSCIP